MNHSEITNKLTKNIHQKLVQCIWINSYVEPINYIIDGLKLKSGLLPQFSKFFAKCSNFSNTAVDRVYTSIKQSAPSL